MSQNLPPRFTSGVATAPVNSLFGNFPKPQPFAANYYINDFNTYAAGDWTVRSNNGGTSALASFSGGQLVLTTGAVDTNFQGMALNPTSFAFKAGYQTWFSINFLCADNTKPSWIVGLTAGGSGAPSSGVYFTKASTSTDIVCVQKGTGTTNVATLTAGAVDATSLSLGIYYDGKPTPTLYYFASSGLTTPVAFQSPFPVYGGVIRASTQTMTNLTANVLQPSFDLIANGGSGAVTMKVDYVMAANEILRF